MKKRAKKFKLNKAQIGILVLVVFCVAVLVYDMTTTDLKGGLNGEAPVAGRNLDGLPEATDVLAPVDPNLSDDDASSGTNNDIDAFFATYRMQREQIRADELFLLDEILNNDSSSDDARQQAEQRKIAIATALEQELLAETVLAAKEFGEAVVLLSDNKATVVLNGIVDEIQAAQVAEVVDSVTGIGYDNVVIINRD